MNSIRYKITNPWGLHARSSACVVSIASTCSASWEVIAIARGKEVNAKSIFELMSLGAPYGAEIEFLSMMPNEYWVLFTQSLESLFFVKDYHGRKKNVYEPVLNVLNKLDINGGHDSTNCCILKEELEKKIEHYQFGWFFEGTEGPQKVRKQKSKSILSGDIDVFISYDSDDFGYAIKVYDALLERGLSVFFAGATISETGESDFQLAIEKSLLKASNMIVVASEPEHLESGWVRAEWTTFLNEKRAGRKGGSFCTVRPPGFDVVELPAMLRMYQSVVMDERGKTDVAIIDGIVNLLMISRNNT